ncbi:MAG: lytic transglycosylase domain-containing protein [Bryobacteraceae bacterium]
MSGKLARVSVGVLFTGAVLVAQPPADFEASVKAAMAPAIARQRATVQKQASAVVTASTVHSSFFTTPFAAVDEAEPDCDPLPGGKLEALIEEAAQKNAVDAQLVRAVIDQESAGRPCALSARGAQGLMQLMPATAEEYDVDDPFDPRQNVEAGTKLLKSLLERYKNDPALALGAYNAGSGRVDREGTVPPIPETVDYVAAILERLRSVTVKTNAAEPAATSTKNAGWQFPPLDLKEF